MIIIRCTAKLLKKLRLEEDSHSYPSTNLLGDWYANIIYTRHGHFILCTSEKSFLPVLFPAKGLKNLPKIFRDELREILKIIDIPSEAIEKEITSMWPLYYGRTKNKVVLGSMNDFVNNFRAIMQIDKDCAILECSLDLAKMPCSPLDYRSPIQVTQEIFRQ